MSQAGKHTVCEGCGAAMSKACAVHDGKGYCRKCYHRLFKPVPCSGGCGKTTRSFGGATPAYCRSCRTIGRTCLRCGKEVRSADLILGDGVACRSCSRYFREAKACPICGLTSHHLARDYRKGFTEPVCPRCRRTGHITCPICGKHRTPGGIAADGRKVCSKCLETEGTFLCPKCGKEGRRHSATSCEACYWREYAWKKGESLVATITREWVRGAFRKFCAELPGRMEPRKAALRIDRYFSFFAALDSVFDQPGAITETKMVSLFGVEGLRRNAVPYGFVKKEGFVQDGGHVEANDAAERKKQDVLLEKFKECWFGPLLGEYLEHLWGICLRYRDRGWTGKRRRFVPRTVTGNLRAAARFLASLSPSRGSVQQLDQLELDRFIAWNPGGRNGIRAFVRFLNSGKKLFTRLTVTTIPANLPRGLFLDHERYFGLLRTWISPAEGEIKESLICLLMALYAQPVKKLVRVKLVDLSRGEEGLYRISFGRAEISLDESVSGLIDRYLPTRTALCAMEDDWENEYFFPGRAYGKHLSEAAVTHYLGKHGITAEAVFSSSLFYSYLMGMKNPKVMVNALGITTHTAMKYCDIFNFKLRNAAERRVRNE